MDANLKKLFNLLLELHKNLLNLQKEQYEKERGQITNSNNYFQLVVSHDDFAWLRLLSTLIAQLDEMIEKPDQFKELVLIEIKKLLLNEEVTDFLVKLRFFAEKEVNIFITLNQIKNILEVLIKNPV